MWSVITIVNEGGNLQNHGFQILHYVSLYMKQKSANEMHVCFLWWVTVWNSYIEKNQ